MSMNVYGGQVTGLIIREEMISVFIERYIKNHPEEFRNIEDPEDEMEMLLQCNESFTRSSAASETDTFQAQLYSDEPFYDTAAIYHMSDINDWHEDLTMPFIVIEADKPLLTRNVFSGKFYGTKDELIEEFRAKVGRYHPEDFDYEDNIGDIEYAVFC